SVRRVGHDHLADARADDVAGERLADARSHELGGGLVDDDVLFPALDDKARFGVRAHGADCAGWAYSGLVRTRRPWDGDPPPSRRTYPESPQSSPRWAVWAKVCLVHGSGPCDSALGLGRLRSLHSRPR